MLYFPTKIPGVIKVSFDEPSSTLFVWYNNKPKQDVYKINRQYWITSILPVITNGDDFRNLLIYGQRNGLVEKVVNAHLASRIDASKHE